MKKIVALAVGSTLLLSGCGIGNSGAASGSWIGAELGSMLGSAIGGISGGPRGSDIGTIVGMATGAAVGAVIGDASDKADQRRAEEVIRRRQSSSDQMQSGTQTTTDSVTPPPSDSGFDPNGGGDDVLYDFDGPDYTGQYTASEPRQEDVDTTDVVGAVDADSIGQLPPLEVRNARFVDSNKDGKISGGELCKVIFEVYNNTAQPVDDVQPMVEETSGNGRIYISPGVHVEQIAPGKGIRYTAMVKADKRLRNGTAHFKVYAVQGNRQTVSPAYEFDVCTERLK